MDVPRVTVKNARLAHMSRLGAIAAVVLALGSSCGSSTTSQGEKAENGPIAVSSFVEPNAGISLREVDGTVRNLTNEPRDSFPVWSTDGSKIAFERGLGGEGTAHLFLMSSDGSDLHQVGDVTVFADQIGMSPDGDQLVYEGDGGIRTIGTDGSGDTLVYASENVRQPAWSPDGERIVFVKTGEGIITISAGGGSAKVVVQHRPADNVGVYVFSGPTWSSDGKRIAFVQKNLIGDLAMKKPSGTLEVVNPDGTGRRVVAKTFSAQPELIRPAWSPDGRSIAFADSRDEQYGIWVVSTNGGKPRLLLEGIGYATPSWARADE